MGNKNNKKYYYENHNHQQNTAIPQLDMYIITNILKYYNYQKIEELLCIKNKTIYEKSIGIFEDIKSKVKYNTQLICLRDNNEIKIQDFSNTNALLLIKLKFNVFQMLKITENYYLITNQNQFEAILLNTKINKQYPIYLPGNHQIIDYLIDQCLISSYGVINKIKHTNHLFDNMLDLKTLSCNNNILFKNAFIATIHYNTSGIMISKIFKEQDKTNNPIFIIKQMKIIMDYVLFKDLGLFEIINNINDSINFTLVLFNNKSFQITSFNLQNDINKLDFKKSEITFSCCIFDTINSIYLISLDNSLYEYSHTYNEILRKKYEIKDKYIISLLIDSLKDILIIFSFNKIIILNRKFVILKEILNFDKIIGIPLNTSFNTNNHLSYYNNNTEEYILILTRSKDIKLLRIYDIINCRGNNIPIEDLSKEKSIISNFSIIKIHMNYYYLLYNNGIKPSSD